MTNYRSDWDVAFEILEKLSLKPHIMSQIRKAKNDKDTIIFDLLVENGYVRKYPTDRKFRDGIVHEAVLTESGMKLFNSMEEWKHFQSIIKIKLTQLI